MMSMSVCPHTNLWMIQNKLIQVAAVCTINHLIMFVLRLGTELAGTMMSYNHILPIRTGCDSRVHKRQHGLVFFHSVVRSKPGHTSMKFAITVTEVNFSSTVGDATKVVHVVADTVQGVRIFAIHVSPQCAA